MPTNEHKANLEHFEAPNQDNDLGRLNIKQIDEQIKFTTRANCAYNYVKTNGFPVGYLESNEVMNSFLKENAAGSINLEDLYALDQAVNITIWDKDIFSQMGINSFVMDKKRFQLKEYLVQSEEWPKFTTQYRNPTFIRMKEASRFSNGIGLQLGISIPFTEIVESQGALWSPRAIMMQELGAKFGLMKSRRGFLGTSCENAYGDDGSDASGYGITGLFNDANVQTFECGAAADDDVTAQADIEISLRVGLTDLKKVYQPGKYYIVSTSGFASEPFLHRDTYQNKLDWGWAKELMKIIIGFQKAGSWGGWWVTEQLYNTTPAVGQQQCMIFKSGPSLIRRAYVYPQQTLPMQNKLYEADIQENMIFGDIIQVKKVDTTYNANPITVAATVTATTTGFIPDGIKIL